MSQQQNPPTVPQMDSEKTNTEADVKPFSIRQYTFSSRQKNILNSWPFPEKYLHMCLNHGIKDVLPPLDGCSYLMNLRDDISKDVNFCKAEVPHVIEPPQNIKNECHLMSNGERYKVTNPSSHEEGNHHNCSVSVNLCQSEEAFTLPSSTHVHKSSPTLASCKAMKDKRKRDRGRRSCKKRTMVDILAVARHCTLEEINRMYKFCYADTVIEGCQQMIPSQNISKS